MPIYKNTSVCRIARGVNAFLRQKAGLTDSDKIRDESSEQEHNRIREQLKETQQQLATVRQKLANKNDKLAELQKVLADLKAASSRQQGSQGHPHLFHCRSSEVRHVVSARNAKPTPGDTL
jgi:hypothetical protein